jgi:hypothetical protein
MFQKIIKVFILITILFLFLSILSYSMAQKDIAEGHLFNLVNNINRTVVFLGDINKEGNPRFYATGALVKVQNIYHLITAKHVVLDRETGDFKDDKMLVFFNSKDGDIMSRPIENAKRDLDASWIFHTNPEVDIAIIPFGIDENKDDVLVIPDELFLLSSNIFELDDIFFLSYQPGIGSKRKISPIFRSRIISITNDDKSFYIDASSFPGNSGSPVFIKPSPITFNEKGISIGSDQLGGKFIGIIGEYVTYQEVAISSQTGRARVIFEENTGLSKVWSVDFIKEIIDSDKFKEQLKKIQGN